MRPLDGIRVLDLTRVVAGPLSTRILADQGAEVLKIEPPEGDLSRTFPPIDSSLVTPYFAQQNAGKRFCSIDLSAPGAPDLIMDLIAVSDVVVENFRPGVMTKFGLGPEEVCERFPELVYCSITGFGQTGPWAKRRAYAPIGHLESGLLHYDQAKIGRPAAQPAVVLGDAVTAMMAASSMNALLVQAARTGLGGHLDVCMIESLVYMQEWVSTELAGGWERSNAGACNEAPMLRLPDGRVWGLAGNPVSWFDHLASVIGQPELLTDPRFHDLAAREEHREEIVEIFVEWAATFETFTKFREVLEAGSPFTAAELRSINDLVETDWALDRELITSTDVGIDVPARPAKGAGIGTTGHVAARGADNRQVLSDVLKMEQAAIDALEESGVLVAER